MNDMRPNHVRLSEIRSPEICVLFSHDIFLVFRDFGRNYILRLIFSIRRAIARRHRFFVVSRTNQFLIIQSSYIL